MPQYHIVKLKNYDDFYIIEEKCFWLFWVRITSSMSLKFAKQEFDRLVRNPCDVVVTQRTVGRGWVNSQGNH